MSHLSLFALNLHLAALAVAAPAAQTSLKDAFLQFPAGTPVSAVEAWLETQNPAFKVADHRQFLEVAPPEPISVMEADMTDILPEYDTPDERPEWFWVQEHASFSHLQNNNSAGVWEFMVHIDRFDVTLPDVLFPVYANAVKAGAAWVLFHQG